jgi:hypothetical protein
MRKRFKRQAGTVYEPVLLLAFIGVTAAVAVPAFVEGAYLRGWGCLALATTPFLYLGWHHFKAWREEKKAERSPEPPPEPPAS